MSKYFQGNPCRRGHDGIRYVSDGKCVRCGAEKGAALWASKRDEVSAKAKAWRELNPARHAENFRKWRDSNAGADKAASLAWQKANRGAVRASIAKRKAALLQRLPAWADLSAIAEVYRRAAELRESTGIRYEVDHIYPLQGRVVSGLHVASNLQILTTSANRKKGNRIANDTAT